MNSTPLERIAIVAIVMAGLVVGVQALNRSDTRDQRKFFNNNISRSDETALMSDSIPTYQVHDVGGTNIWIRYQSSDSTDVFIKQVSTIGETTTITKVTGLWTNKENLVYLPFND